MIKFYALLILSICGITKLSSQTVNAIDSSAIDAIMHQHTSENLPGMALGIVHQGEIIFEDYLGYANFEFAVDVDQNTRFNIASNGKQFTALCILKLQSEGKLDIDDDIRKYLQGFYSSIEDPITIRQLLAHSSGTRDIHTLWSLQGKNWWKTFVGNEEALELLKAQRDLNFKPGSDYLYSNSNYILLTEIVKVVSGQDFDEYAKDLFASLDMSQTSYLSNYMEVIPNRARPYAKWEEWREFPSVTDIHGDGNLYTTLGDQLKWEQIIQQNNGQYLSEDLIQASQEALQSFPELAYGYGLQFEEYEGLNYSFHDGSSGAYHATFLRFPEYQLSVVIMANSGAVPSNYAAWQVAKLFIEIEDPVRPEYPGLPENIEDFAKISDLEGHYQNEDGTVIKIVQRGDSLYREIYDRKPTALIQEEKAMFQYQSLADLKMNFSNISKEDQAFTLYLSSQEPATYYKKSDLSFNQYDKEALNARFVNAETGTEIKLQYQEGDRYTLSKNGRARDAQLILADFLLMNSYEIYITRDNQGRVNGLLVNNGRMQKVKFERVD